MLRGPTSGVLLFACLLGSAACGGKTAGSDSEPSSASGGGQGGSSANGSSSSCGPVSATPKVIGPLKASATRLVADSDAVYWCETDGRDRSKPSVVRWDVATGKLTSLAEARCTMMVGDGGVLFWTGGAQLLGRIDKDGNGSEILFTRNEPAGSITNAGWYDLAVDATFVYWADFRDTGGIYRGPKTGGSSELLVAEPFARGVAVDDEAVYWVAENGVKKRSKATGETTVLGTGRARGGLGASNLQLDGELVYWLSSRGIERTRKAGGESEVFVRRDGEVTVSAISIQAGCMYFSSAGGLYRRPLTNGPEVRVASQTRGGGIAWFAATDTGIFWADWSGYEDKGEVYMLPLVP